MMTIHIDPYEILGIDFTASQVEIKSAYRTLVKKHHPDAGGNAKLIIAINAAWELLRNPETKKTYDLQRQASNAIQAEAKERGRRNARASDDAKQAQGASIAVEGALIKWVKEVYLPIDRLLAQIINPFPEKLKELSADPYDDELMESFCSYLETSKKRIKIVLKLYQSMHPPMQIHGFGLDLYHCLSQVEDALNEFERYTMGYVDDYLHDGREMLREAKRKRLRLLKDRRQLPIA